MIWIFVVYSHTINPKNQSNPQDKNEQEEKQSVQSLKEAPCLSVKV